jgi:hypothetical protein
MEALTLSRNFACTDHSNLAQVLTTHYNKINLAMRPARNVGGHNLDGSDRHKWCPSGVRLKDTKSLITEISTLLTNP